MIYLFLYEWVWVCVSAPRILKCFLLKLNVGFLFGVSATLYLVFALVSVLFFFVFSVSFVMLHQTIYNTMYASIKLVSCYTGQHFSSQFLRRNVWLQFRKEGVKWWRMTHQQFSKTAGKFKNGHCFVFFYKFWYKNQQNRNIGSKGLKADLN